MMTFASITGAWIETGAMSEVMQVIGSRPSRARGLKPTIKPFCQLGSFASITSAWIETLILGNKKPSIKSASITAAWIET